MSLESLQADQRYQDARRELDSQIVDLNDPAFIDGRVATRTELLTSQMTALAIEHGWNVERQEWTETKRFNNPETIKFGGERGLRVLRGINS